MNEFLQTPGTRTQAAAMVFENLGLSERAMASGGSRADFSCAFHGALGVENRRGALRTPVAASYVFVPHNHRHVLLYNLDGGAHADFAARRYYHSVPARV